MGGAGGYDDDTLWSVAVAKNIEQGIGYTVNEEGFYYSELDTLSDRFSLPSFRRTSTLRQLSISGDSDRAHFAEVGDRLFMAYGSKLYEWDSTNLWFNVHMDIGVYVDSMVYFDGYLHIAGERRYVYINPETRATGFITTFDYVNLFHVFGGLLYVATGDAVRYTNGSDWAYGDVDYPSLPTGWTWTDPIQIGSYGEQITGMAGLIYQQIAQRYIWVSTASSLSVIMPGDIAYGIAEWPAKDERNGVEMVEFYDMILITIGGNIMSIRGNGDLNGMDIGNAHGLPCERDGSVDAIFTAANYPMAVVNGAVPTVWANHSSGWHFVAKARGTVVGGYHSNRNKTMTLVNSDGEVFSYYMGDTSRDPLTDDDYRYERSGVLDLGWYAGALFETVKYWREVFVDVICDEGYIEVLYLTSNDESCDPCNSIDYDAWTSAGYATSENPIVKLPSDLVSRRIRIAVRLRSADYDTSPSFRAVGVRYAPRVKQRRRWSFTVSLPRHCMNDVYGQALDEYSQKAWDDRMWEICEGTHPVVFQDIDMRQYEVLVDNSNRIVSDLGCAGDEFGYEVQYSLSLVEAS